MKFYRHQLKSLPKINKLLLFLFQNHKDVKCNLLQLHHELVENRILILIYTLSGKI